MKRKAQIIRSSDDGSIKLCVDGETKSSILNFITRNEKTKKKFNYIAEIILKRLKIPDVYDKEDLDGKYKGVTAMKFFKGGGSNDRIYCKCQTIDNTTYIIVMVVVLEKKKTQKLNQRILNILDKISDYEYEIEK